MGEKNCLPRVVRDGDPDHDAPGTDHLAEIIGDALGCEPRKMRTAQSENTLWVKWGDEEYMVCVFLSDTE